MNGNRASIFFQSFFSATPLSIPFLLLVFWALLLLLQILLGELGIKSKHFICIVFICSVPFSLFAQRSLMGNRKIVTSHYRAIDLPCDVMWCSELTIEMLYFDIYLCHIFAIVVVGSIKKILSYVFRLENQHTHTRWFSSFVVVVVRFSIFFSLQLGIRFYWHCCCCCCLTPWKCRILFVIFMEIECVCMRVKSCKSVRAK